MYPNAVMMVDDRRTEPIFVFVTCFFVQAPADMHTLGLYIQAVPQGIHIYLLKSFMIVDARRIEPIFVFVACFFVQVPADMQALGLDIRAVPQDIYRSNVLYDHGCPTDRFRFCLCCMLVRPGSSRCAD